jgi:predicted metalloendopeptidase
MKSPLRILAASVACALAGSASASLDVANFDKSANPCTDFYDYVNGKWIQSATIPADRTSWGPWTELVIRNEKIVLGALDELARNPAPAGSWQGKVGAFYKSGMDLEGIERAGLKPLEPYLERARSVQGAQDLADTLAALHAVGIGPGFDVDVEADRKDSAHYLLNIGQGGLGLPDRDYYFRTDEKSRAQREAYVKHVARTLELAGADAASAERDAATVLDMETALAKASMTAVERRDEEKTYNKMTRAALAESAPGFPWDRYFKALGADRAKSLNVQQPAFMQAFAEMAARRPAADWQVYLRWQILASASATLPDAFNKERFDFNDRVLQGTKEMPSRQRQVLLVIGGRYGAARLGQGVGRLYVERAFTPEAKARATELVRNVRTALADRIRNSDWMTEATRKLALEKLDRMKSVVGYPDHWRDLSDAQVGDYPFVENWLRGNAFDHRRDMRRIGGPVDRDNWLMGQYIVNAYYEQHLNQIVLPAAILQPPFFDAKADDAVNYGGIGMVIGHEITHGFDDRGRLFDAHGNMRDWWTPQDAKQYVTRADRVVEQYNAFKVDDIQVNGKLTLSENIADQGGLAIAYSALHKAIAHKNPGKIDGLTPEQRFFLAYAETWRMKQRPEIERLYLRIDGHSLPRFRVLGPLQQMPEFARAFQCEPSKTLISESQRANIW